MTFPHVSWSQIEKYRLCPRRWSYSKHRPDIVEPPSESLLLGNECHEIAEAHYEGREPRGLRYETHVAYDSTRQLLTHPDLPKPTDDIRVEYPRDRVMGFTLAGVPVQGRIDLLRGVGDDRCEVYDWKTLSSWKTAKSGDELERFGQMILYGAWAFTKMPALETVRFFHGQILTKGVASRLTVTGPLDRDHVFGILPSLERTVEEMVADYPSPPEEVRADTSACRAFNRPCPYFDLCPKASILSGITATPTAAPTPQTGGSTMSSLKEKLAARAKAASAVAISVPTEGSPNTPVAVIATGIATGVNPPDAAKPDTSKAGSYAAATTTTAPPPAGDASGVNGTLEGASIGHFKEQQNARLELIVGGRRYAVTLSAVD